MNFALIGVGYWGRNYIRVIGDSPAADVVCICDASSSNLESIHDLAPGPRLTDDLRDVLEDDEIDAVVVATPASTHFDIARAALEAGKQVLCEKPLALTTGQCEKLIEIADGEARVLFVGHTFIYNPGVRAAQQLVRDGMLGRVRHCDATWAAPGPVRDDVDAVWDLAPHPLSILTSFFGSVTDVSATGQAILNGADRADLAVVHLSFHGGATAHVHVSWVAPRKVRSLTITGDRRVAIFDDLAAADKLQVFETEAALARTTPGVGEASTRAAAAPGAAVAIRDIPAVEPLRAQLDHFVECCKTGVMPESNGERGQAVVRILEAAQASLGSGGRRVQLASAAAAGSATAAPA
jgi:predicted dehydrogenase